MISNGELLVRAYLIAGNTLECIDGKPRYQKLIGAKLNTGGLELKVSAVDAEFSKEGAKAIQDSLKEASKEYDAVRRDFKAKSKPAENILKNIDSIVENSPDSPTAHSEVEKLMGDIRNKGYTIKTSIDIPSVLAANEKLSAEAKGMANSGVYAAQPVAQYIDDAVNAATTSSVGRLRLPTFGLRNKSEKDVRDYFFIHNLLKGKGWGLVNSESGFLLFEGREYAKAISQLDNAAKLGYDGYDVISGLGKAHMALSEDNAHLEAAINNFMKIMEYAPYDHDTNIALGELFSHKAKITSYGVNSQMIDVKAARQLKASETTESIIESRIPQLQKASLLYLLGASYLFPEVHTEKAIEALNTSLAIQPRKETYAVLSSAHLKRAELQ